MEIIVNGKPYTFSPASTLADAVASFTALAQKRVVVAVNQTIIPKTHYVATMLHEGDAVEIIEAVGGG